MPGIYLESLGAHKLKNIRQPVQVYRVTLADSIEADALDVRTSAQLSAKEVWGGQPSIAVLPLGTLVETQVMHILQRILSKALSRY